MTALLFDLATRTFPGATVDDVDQAVALALGIRKGAIPSAPGVGNPLRNIKRAGGPRYVAEATDMVRTTLAPWVDRGDIVIVDIEVGTPARGAVAVAVSYVNQRTRKRMRATLST